MSISKVQNLSSILRQMVLWNENNDAMTIDFENEANILPIPYFPGIKFNIDILLTLVILVKCVLIPRTLS